ncbi:MAG: MBL fold metallo-hydrolase, partial [Solirubrobacteraceae bacterium]|nr:MBL fold metallo-hydrolase [Solirubrobacteraceae bacterium]
MSSADRAWQQIGPGVFAWIHGRGDWGESNAGLVIGAGEEVLLVDTQWDERTTAEMLHAAPLPEGATIGTLINTHADGDHTWGNAVVGAPRIIATEAAAAAFAHESPQRLARLASVASATQGLPLVRVPFVGAPLTQFQLLARYYAVMAAGWEYGSVRLTHPTDTFSGTFELKVGDRPVSVIEVGPAHAEGDAMVHLPDDGILFAGDILFAGSCPIMWVGPMTNWLAALDRIDALAPETIVPGHGPVCTLADVQTLRDYLTWAISVGERQRKAGESPAKAAAAALRGRDYQRAPWSDWVSPERLIVTLTVLQREAEGEGPIESIADRA